MFYINVKSLYLVSTCSAFSMMTTSFKFVFRKSNGETSRDPWGYSTELIIHNRKNSYKSIGLPRIRKSQWHPAKQKVRNMSGEESLNFNRVIDDYKRDYGASWEKNSNLIPITKPEKGLFKMINFSYFSPYDVVTAPFRAMTNILKQREITPKDAQDSLLYEFVTGPINQLISPFVSESILFEKVADVLPAGYGVGSRGGVTKTGTKIICFPNLMNLNFYNLFH